MLSVLLAATIAAPPALPPNIVIFGGGWGPEGTQASIEAHVVSLARALGAGKPAVLFAGESSVRSVQVALQDEDEVGALLGIVFDRSDHLQVGYRKKQIPSAASSRASLLAAITANAGADGLIVFGAGHGSPAEGNEEAAIDLWGPEDKLPVRDLARHLDQLKRGPIALVLGQCHSGAFTDLIYTGGKGPKLAAPSRCVLAAVPYDREASGCTPDVGDPSAQAYLAMIAEAFAKGIDFDGDGATSLADAHAYARINDHTVDVPVSSSEAWLTARLGKRLPRAEHVKLAAVLPSARPTERAVLEKLEAGRLLEAGAKETALDLEDVEARIAEGADKLDEALQARDRLRRHLIDAVLASWPELANPYHRVSREMLAGDASEVVALVKQRPEWIELLRRDEEIRARDQQLLSLEKQAAMLARFVRAVQVVAGERMLSRADRAAYSVLLACEGMKPRVR